MKKLSKQEWKKILLGDFMDALEISIGFLALIKAIEIIVHYASKIH